jgi:hypothetical protein
LNVKVCLIVLLCLLSISIVYSVATRTLPTIALSSHSSNNKTIVAKYLTLGGNDTQPDGEGKGGGGWPL